MNDNSKACKTTVNSMGKTFKRTGHNVTVARNDLINVAIDSLMKYDSMSPAQRSKMSNPYSDPVYTKVAGGKTVQVPRFVQNAAITRWTIMKRRASDTAAIDADKSFINGGCNINPSAHTRLTKRERYSFRDPFIMNKDLQYVEGAH